MKFNSIFGAIVSLIWSSPSWAMRITYGDRIFDDQTLEHIRETIEKEEKSEYPASLNESFSNLSEMKASNRIGISRNSTFTSLKPGSVNGKNDTSIPLRYKFDYGQHNPKTESLLALGASLGETVVSTRMVKHSHDQKMRGGRVPEMDFGENFDLGSPVTSGTLYVYEKQASSNDDGFEGIDPKDPKRDEEITNSIPEDSADNFSEAASKHGVSLEHGDTFGMDSDRITDEGMEGFEDNDSHGGDDRDKIGGASQDHKFKGKGLYYIDDDIDEKSRMSKHLQSGGLDDEEKNERGGFPNELEPGENQEKTTRLYQYEGSYADRLWYKSGNHGKPETTKLFPIEGVDSFGAAIQNSIQNQEEPRLRDAFSSVQNDVRDPIKTIVHSVEEEMGAFLKQNQEESRLRDVFLSVQNSARDPIEIMVHRAEEKLGSFIGQLKSFIKFNGFDTSEFDSQKPELWQELSMLDETSESLHESKAIVDQLRFAKHLFEVMNEAAYQIRFYSVSGAFDHALVNCLINLNIGLYSLYNSYGDPDPGIEGFSDTVLLQKSYLKLWKRMFELLPRPSDEVVNKFAEQHFEATYKLKWFESMI